MMVEALAEAALRHDGTLHEVAMCNGEDGPAAGMPAASPVVCSAGLAMCNPLLTRLVTLLSEQVGELRSAALCRLLFALGTLHTRACRDSPLPSHDIEFCLSHVCARIPFCVTQCSPVDLVNALHGLASVYPGSGDGHKPLVSDASKSILLALVERWSSPSYLSPERLGNVIWAVTRLEMHGPAVQAFFNWADTPLDIAAALRDAHPCRLARRSKL